MKQKSVLVIAVVVGLLAFGLSRQYFRSRLTKIEELRQQVLAGARTIDVVAAARDLPADTVLQKSDLLLKASYDRDVGRDTVLQDDIEQVLGKKLRYGLSRRQTLLWTYVDVPYRPGGGLGPMISPRMRAVSIPVSGAAAVSGLVQPNDRVDVLGTFTFPSKTRPDETEVVTLTLLQDVTVLATGQTLGRPPEPGTRARPAGAYSTVTFEVTPREAELLVFAETLRGRLTLALRNPADVSFETDLPEVNFQHIESRLPELNQYRQTVIRRKGKL
jgi:pilus assembly protein CpaB